MRKALLILSNCFIASSFAQGEFATVYVTPPTNGCNGVWAVQALSVYCTPVSPYTFAMEPSGCVQLTGWGEQMGNFLIPLCSIPCSLSVTSADGVTCSGSTTDTPIGITENQPSHVRMSVHDRSIDMISDTNQPAQRLRLVDVSGRTLQSTMLHAGQRWSIPAPSTAGAYTIIIEGGMQRTAFPFVITQ